MSQPNSTSLESFVNTVIEQLQSDPKLDPDFTVGVIQLLQSMPNNADLKDKIEQFLNQWEKSQNE